jgi:hypothetical protein
MNERFGNEATTTMKRQKNEREKTHKKRKKKQHIEEPQLGFGKSCWI